MQLLNSQIVWNIVLINYFVLDHLL